MQPKDPSSATDAVPTPLNRESYNPKSYYQGNLLNSSKQRGQSRVPKPRNLKGELGQTAHLVGHWAKASEGFLKLHAFF